MAIPADTSARLRAHVRDIPDFPKPGVMFRDLTPLMANHARLSETAELLAAPFHDARITAVVGIEARGFLLAPLVAMRLGVGVVPIRKPGKLPSATIRKEYALEYGTDALEVHSDALHAGDRVVIVDDVLATGGTAAAASSLVAALGAHVHGFAFVVELGFLGGRSLLNAVFDTNREIQSLLTY